jgi:hypothetical protein
MKGDEAWREMWTRPYETPSPTIRAFHRLIESEGLNEAADAAVEGRSQ